MKSPKLAAETEWLLAMAKKISSVRSDGKKDRLISLGPKTLGRKAIRVMMVREKMTFKNFMAKAKDAHN